MNTPVKFELAKLLKEKGYPFEFITVGELKEVPLNIPTIAEVVMWLYEKHNIWIEVYFDGHQKNFYIVQNGEEIEFNSPTEAYEAAITYCLNNLL